MAPKCNCWLVSKKAGNPVQYYFNCRQGNQTRQFRIDSNNPVNAEVLVCNDFENFWESGTIVSTGSIGGGCLPRSAEVKLADGSMKSIGEIDVGDVVVALDYERQEVVTRQVEGIHYSYNQPLVSTLLDSDDQIVTSFGQFLITSFGPIRARHLFQRAALISSSSVSELRNDEIRVVRGRTVERGNADVVSLDIGGDFAFLTLSARSLPVWVGCHSGDDGMDDHKK